VSRLLPLTALLLLAAGGCGGDDDDDATTVRSGESIVVVADEYSFDPERIEAEGGAFEIRLENRGVLAHNLRVFDGGSDVGGTPTFTRGKKRDAVLDLDPGDYELVCTVGNHAEQGMTGNLTVR
jgi:plastocyanin